MLFTSLYKFQQSSLDMQDNALFHIFSGPLFANVQGYAYLDLLVWGLSPLSFLFLRGKFLSFFKGKNRGVRNAIFKGLILLSCIVFISYFFLNYSPLFNWNYFSRTFNIEVGYFIFDMLIRTYELLVQVQQQQQPDKECQSYCQFQHATITLSYFLVFYLSSTFEINQRNNGPIIFAICCVFSFISVIFIPILYYFHHRDQINSYSQIYTQDQYQIQSEEVTKQLKSSAQLFQQPKSTIMNVIAMSLINLSLVINTNYFSLWMMQPLGTSAQSSYQQYNITIQMVSGCFLLSSVGYYICFKLFQQVRMASLISRFLLMIYGIFLVLCFWNYQVNFVSVLVLGFGFHQVCNMQFANMTNNHWKIDIRFYLKNEVFAYFIMPILFNILNIGQTSLQIYPLVSGVFLILGTMLY